MKLPALVFASMIVLPTALAQEKTTAEWIPELAKIAPGQPFRTVVRMKVDEGWHTYWENPGEGGMPVAVKAELPDDWTLGEIQFPAPIRFMTGSLPGFGYEGEVLFPLTITPPAGSEVTELPAGIATKISWLTCNDQTCVPGSAEPTLSAANSALVEKAYAQLPKEIPGATLHIFAGEKNVSVTLSIPEESNFDPVGCEVFPVTRNIIAPASKPLFLYSSSEPRIWHFSAPKSEYLEGAPKELSIVVVSSEGESWKISTAPK